MNGLNLRASSKDQAALVLQHAGNSITMKVQFNPGDYHSMLTLASSHEDERVRFFLCKYRGSLPNATFGSGKKSY